MPEPIVVKVASTDEEKKALFVLRTRVYSKWGYIESDKEKDIDEYDQDAKSIHFVAKFEGEVIGTIRLIFAEKGTLPIEKEFDLVQHFTKIGKVDRKEIVEVSRMVSGNHLNKKFNDNRVMIALMKAIHDYAYAHNKLFWLAAIDNDIYDRFNKLGIIWNEIGKERYYLGSTSVPAEIYLPEAMEKLRNNNFGMWRLIAEESEIIKVV